MARNNRPRIVVFITVALAALSALMVWFQSCHFIWDGGDINQDVKALLSLNSYEVFDLEKAKDYTTLYREHFGKVLKATITEEDFLARANCLENYLGGVHYYEQDLKMSEKQEPKRRFFQVKTEVSREFGTVHEQLDFVREGIRFKLLRLHWDTNNKNFLFCLRDLTATPEADTANKPDKTSPSSTEAGQNKTEPQPAQPDGQTGNGTASNDGQLVSPTDAADQPTLGQRN